MPVYQMREEQWLPAGVDEIWEFISSPENLKEITPDYMGFDITTDHLPEKMYPGMIISYRVSPLLGIKMNWVTEITHVRDREYFVDEQRHGPYTMWHHQHHIKSEKGGVRMTDVVTYKPPLGPIGALANVFVIRRQLKEIFDYRRTAMEKRFPS